MFVFCSVKTLAHSVADKQSKMLSLILEDRCTLSQNYSVYPLEVSKEALISSLKTTALLTIGATDVEGTWDARTACSLLISVLCAPSND